MKATAIVLLLLFSIGCSTRPVTPDKEDLKVSRETPDEDCESLGKVTGTTQTVKGTAEQALEDMKQEAANKGANYLQVMQYSSNQTSVTGMAFVCR